MSMGSRLLVLLSLRARILIGLVLTWALILVGMLWSGWMIGKDLVREVNFEHLHYESRLIADAVSDEVQTRLDVLERMAASIRWDVLSDPEQSALLNSQALLGLFDRMVVIDNQGSILASWPNSSKLSAINLADREYFSMVRGTRQAYVSEPIYSRISGNPVVVVVVPVLDGSHLQGMVAGVVDLREGDIFEQISRIRLGTGGYAVIFTASGRMLYHPNGGWVMHDAREILGGPAIEQAIYGWQGEFVGPRHDGEVAYQSYRQVWPANWIIGVFFPEDEGMTPLSGLVGQLGWIGVVMAGVMLPLLAWQVVLLLKPLYRLKRQIAQVGAGLRDKVKLRTSMKELVQLADAFNEVDDGRNRALMALRDRQAFIEAVLASSPQGMFVTDTQGRINYMNEALVTLSGRRFDVDREMEWIDAIHADDRSEAIELWYHSMQTGKEFLRQFRYWRVDGELLWLEVHASQVVAGDAVIGFVGTVKDITSRREEEVLRQWEAEHDPLTGLLNRRGFERRLEEALADWRKKSTPSALILFDLDHFKAINDDGGHALGDEMLRLVAEQMAGSVRSTDHVARQGGDEFAVLLPSCSLQQMQHIAEQLIDAINGVEVRHRGCSYRVTPSLGVTEFREGDENIHVLIQRADAACYQAKQRGRNRIVVAGEE
ncbi:PAS domain S-box-containing protein/diguanylate cyclase (GGDEF) domain-containing protein [Halomonas cupida]|uniref:PAS domain S-box-containing protein/diguanylate cyclase (GGDEF) domain-containing protein n=2 Tax=Halomonas cupida TaxID=44933 RepID=A0A1M7EVY5_9GAMM|nr:PAS domain S-box-containing protein/diguanylate cyclase (GGDEF) domain-containing protein [Halomonas cupida]